MARKLKKIPKKQQNKTNIKVVKIYSNCDKTKTQIVTKLKNLHLNKTQKLKFVPLRNSNCERTKKNIM